MAIKATPSKRRRESYRRTVEAFAVGERCMTWDFGRLLDFGCGTGWFVSYFCSRGLRVIGVEVRPEVLVEARHACLEDEALFVWYEGKVLPLQSEAMDVVLGVGVVRSLMDRGPLEGSVREWHRCLRPGGSLLLLETDNRAFRHYMRPDELRLAISGSGFECVVWYPIRKVSWWGLHLVKWGLAPKGAYDHLARWELWFRRRNPWAWGKHAYLGEFRKSST